jgi:hypothetical protein
MSRLWVKSIEIKTSLGEICVNNEISISTLIKEIIGSPLPIYEKEL